MHKTLLTTLSGVFFMMVLLLFSSSSVLAANPTLTLTPSTTSLYQGQSFTVAVGLQSDGNQHSETYFEISYDPALLQATAVQQNNLYFNYLNNSTDNVTGLVTLRGNYFGGSQTSSGTMATLSFTALAAGTPSISLTSNTEILNQSATAYPDSFSAPVAMTITSVASDAMLTLTSQYPSWALNDQQTVSVSLDTKGNSITGADLIILYDPTLFQFSSNQWMSLLPNQQGFSVDQANGRITISGLTEQSSPFNGAGELVRLRFTSLAVGTDSFTFDWTLNSTTDTNIVSASNPNIDLLSQAPTALAITVVDKATFSFKFGLLDFLGNISSKNGTVTVVTPNISNAFSNPSSLGEIFNLALGTFEYGINHDLVLRVPGYLAKKQTQLVTSGANPSTGVIDYGNLTPGDINQDNVNNTFDLFAMFNSWNGTGPVPADLNGDAKVNTFDVGILYAYFNQTAAL